MFKCVVVLDELKFVDIIEKYVIFGMLCNLCILNNFIMYCEIIGNENFIWNVVYNKSDYKDNVRKFWEEKKF